MLHRYDLSKAFLKRYLSKTGSIETKMDEQLFLFYKLYRSNVRMKVLAIDARDTDTTGEQREEDMRTIRQYLELCKKYSEDFEKYLKMGRVQS